MMAVDRLVYPHKRMGFITPDRIEVLDVERDTNGKRPACKVFTFHPATEQPDQRYWTTIDDDELGHWYDVESPVSYPGSIERPDA